MRASQRVLTTAVAAATLFVAACSGSASMTTGASSAAPATVVATVAPTTAAASPTSAPTTVASPSAAAAATPSAGVTASSASTPASSAAASTDVIKYTVDANGTQAGYQVQEQLARLKAPSQAIGTTKAVSGSIVIGSDGKIVSNQSKIVVDLKSLHSDISMRDGFIDRNTLDIAKYPTATFVPTEIKGLASPLPTSGSQTFQLLGNLTVHGVSHPVTWNVTSQVNGNNVTGKATTDVKFEDFGMSPPKALAVLSVTDNITLNLTFHLTKAA